MADLKIRVFKHGETQPETTVTIPGNVLNVASKLIPNKALAALKGEGIDLNELIKLSQNPDVRGTLVEIERLGRRHKELDVTPEMYTMWLDSLCEAIRKHDPEYTPELEQRWRQAMQKGIDVMLAVE